MMRALISKDLQLVKLVWALALVSVPISLVLTATTVYASMGSSQTMRESAAQTWASILSVSSQIAYGIGYLSVSLLAGSIIAGERQAKTAPFLACLPPLRHHNVISKGTVVLGFIFLWTLICAGLMLLSNALGASAGVAPANRSFGIVEMAQLLIGCGGVAWAASSISRTTIFPILVGLVAPMCVAPLVSVLFRYFDFAIEITDQGTLIIHAVFLVGCAGFVVGSYLYLTGREE